MKQYFLRHADKQTLLDALHANRFYHNEEGEPYEPEQGAHSHANRADAVYLGKPVLTPAELDEDGNETAPPIISELYCANVVSQTPLDFGDIDTTEPNSPVSRFAL
jgi:hypothetical protein